jgi:hypothetical protein
VSLPRGWPQVLDLFGTPLVIEPPQGQLSSAAGLLPVRQFDHRLDLTRAFNSALDVPLRAFLMIRRGQTKWNLLRRKTCKSSHWSGTDECGWRGQPGSVKCGWDGLCILRRAAAIRIV